MSASREATAYHEAGHAAALHHLMLQYHLVELCPPGSGTDVSGHVVFHPEQMNKPLGESLEQFKTYAEGLTMAEVGDRVEHYRKLCTVLVAGDVAVDLARRQGLLPADERHATAPTAGDLTAFGVYCGFVYVNDCLHRPVPVELIKAERLRARLHAEVLLSSPMVWDGVVAIAGALLEQGRLLYHRALDIYREAIAGADLSEERLGDLRARFDQDPATQEAPFRQPGCCGPGPCSADNELRACPARFGWGGSVVMCRACWGLERTWREQENVRQKRPAARAHPVADFDRLAPAEVLA